MNISAELQQLPHWDGMSAYDRALACCRLLSQYGQPIPGWMQLRQWIGKGSANDIHRAKQDFLQGQQPNLEAAKTESLPPALTGTLDAWWQQVRQAAADEFAAQTADWQQQLVEADARCAEYAQQLQDAQDVIEQQTQQIEDLRQERDQSIVATRRAEDANLEAQTRLQATMQALATWQTELEQQQRELWQQAIEQLSGLQDFATTQIEQARQQAHGLLIGQQQQAAQQLTQIQQHYSQSLTWLEQHYRQSHPIETPTHRLIRRGMQR